MLATNRASVKSVTRVFSERLWKFFGFILAGLSNNG